MRLERNQPRRRLRLPPLRTVSEIAEHIGIATTQLVWALNRDGAPQAALRALDAVHLVTGNNKVWYEPRAVIKWWRDFEANDSAAARREYHRNYRRKRAAKSA